MTVQTENICDQDGIFKTNLLLKQIYFKVHNCQCLYNKYWV